MRHIIVKTGIENSVMARDLITRDQNAEDGRTVRGGEAVGEDGGEGEGMGQTILKIRDGKGIGLAADRNLRVIHHKETDGMVSPILGGDLAGWPRT